MAGNCSSRRIFRQECLILRRVEQLLHGRRVEAIHVFHGGAGDLGVFLVFGFADVDADGRRVERIFRVNQEGPDEALDAEADDDGREAGRAAQDKKLLRREPR